jgi:hypothetical protein
MMDNPEPTITLTISRDEAYEFLRELAEDDDLRARVEADPGGELAARGIVIARELLPEQARLASKDQIAELIVLLGDDPANLLGRPKAEAWPFQLLSVVFMFGALPFVQREAQLDAP